MNQTFIKNRNRSDKLIATFEGYAENWFFKVHKVFRDALDIKLTERIKNKKKESVWTQGNIYNFQQGDMITDYVSKNETWGHCLKKMKYCLQVEAGSPCTITEKNLPGKKGYLLDHGYVKFSVFKPNEDKTALEFSETRECTQVEFIKILECGLDQNTPEQKESNSDQLELFQF